MAKQSKETMHIKYMLMSAMMMAIIMILTYAIRIPAVATRGYVHLGDCAIFLAVLLMGRRYGAVTAGIGSALADMLGGYPYFVPVTFVVKAVMAWTLGFFLEMSFKKERSQGTSIALSVLGMILAGFIEVGGYYLGEVLMYGSWVVPIAELPLNIAQFVIAILIAMPLAISLAKTPFGRYFTYKVTDSGWHKRDE